VAIVPTQIYSNLATTIQIKHKALMILLYVWLYNVYEYFLFKKISFIVRYLFTNFSITSFEETPNRGAFSIHNNP
jgi:hypothetical protein